jgi:hypothetical protein
MLIIAGGQTGVDRVALDIAIELGIPYSGWCPHGGWAEDMPSAPGLLEHYPSLRPTPLADTWQRTFWNIRDSDALLFLVGREGLAPSPGSFLAHKAALAVQKPVWFVDPGQGTAVAESLAWVQRIDPPGALGIGGPRESEVPGIYQAAASFLRRFLVELTRNG